MSELLVRLIRERAWITREINICQTELEQNDSELTVENLEFLKGKILGRLQKYETTFDEYLSTNPETGPFEKENKEFDKIRIAVNQQSLKAQKRIQTLKSVPSNLPSPVTNTDNPATPFQQGTKLQMIKIPEFSGKHEEWAEFWDIYNSLVHSNQNLDYIVKFTHLRHALTGMARESIKGFATTNQDYLEAVNFLQKEYADKRRVKQVLIKRFLEIQKPELNPHALLTFKQEIETTLRCLKGFYEVDNSLWLVTGMILRLLPIEVEKFIMVKYQNEYLTYNEIVEGLGQYITWIEHSGEYKK